MKIGIDARGLHWPGVGRYIRELIYSLAEVDKRNQYVLYFYSREALESIKISNQNFFPVIMPATCMTVREQFLLPVQLIKDKLDLFHATCFVVPIIHHCPLIVTIHDLQLKINREWFPPFHGIRKYIARAYYDIMNWDAVKYSRNIITVSHFTREEILHYFPKVDHKLSVVYHGINKSFCPIQSPIVIRQIKEKYNITGKYILFVGTMNKRKNLVRVLKAFSNLQRDLDGNYKLVVAAKFDPRYSELIHVAEKLRITDKVLFIGYVPTEDLPPLYSGSDLFVLPSLHESFCFPVVEAMACGVPVITSNVTSLPEIAGDAAYLVDPYNIEEIKKALIKVLFDQSLRRTLIEKGLSRARRFSWETVAKRMISIYEGISRK